MKNEIVLFLIFLFSMSSFSQINNEHLKIGERAPLINGFDQFGKAINSQEILKNNQILVVFYRGNWCLYCRKHLASLQENLEALSNKGLFVIVVTPEKAEKIKETTKKFDATFSIVHDIDNTIMKNYKVAFDVNNQNVINYFDFTKKKIAEYNDKDNNILPVPATYLIDKEGKVAFVQYDPDYHVRSDFKEILKML